MKTPSKRPRTLAEYRALAASEPSHSFLFWAMRLRGVPAAETAAALRRAAARVGGHPLGGPAAALLLLLDIDPPADAFAPLRDIAEGWISDCPCEPAAAAFRTEPARPRAGARG